MTSDTQSPKPRRNRKKGAQKSRANRTRRERAPRGLDVEPASVSPAATGPAGSLLEGHVGAQYLLSLLSGGEARGLPGVVVTRVAFQRAAYNHPMDDVIVTGHDGQGRPATLELQAKRTIDFSASDKIFADVVAFACRAAAKPEFQTTRYELAVAIAHTSTKIEHHIQDVLKWARDYQDSNGFFYRLDQPGAAHQAKRSFVQAFRDHMRIAGAANDDAAVWHLLRHFQVLAFDFEQAGSVCAQLARERCALQLAVHDAGCAAELWDSLQQIALQVDAAGGDLDATELRKRLVDERAYRLAGDRRLHHARKQVADIAESTLNTINTNVRGVEIDRTATVAAALEALEQGRYLEIRGAGGVGKSGVLKELAQRIGVESRVVVVGPHRVPPGGWAAFAAQLGCELSAREFLTDLAGDGGSTLFVDGIDRFDDPGQQATIVDLICAAAHVPAFGVVVTARLDFDADARAWLPTQALQQLREAPPLIVSELRDGELNWLRTADPALAALLRPGHPAAKLVSNLYRLDRLAREGTSQTAMPFSEARMARQWWTTGDAGVGAGRLERRRVLRSLALHSLTSSVPMDTLMAPVDAITALTESGSLRLLNSVRVELAHDVLRDWAIGNLLFDEPEHFTAIALDSPAPTRLVRGVELASRLHAEFGSDEAGWRALVDQVSVPGAHGSWRRAVLLALARSERADDALTRCLPALAANEALLLADLVRAAVTVDSQPLARLWAAVGAPTEKLPDDFVAPLGPAWLNLILWSMALGERLPEDAIPQFVDLYSRWCSALGGRDPLSPLLARRLYMWLVEVEARNHPRASSFGEWMARKEAPGLSMTSAQECDLRVAFLMWCKLCPAEAASYLQGVATHPHRHVLFRQLLPFVGTAPYAAPQALVDLFLQALVEGDSDEEDRESRIRDVFSHWDLQYFPSSPARPPFLDLLQANREEGLRLVRGVVAHAVRRRSRNRDPGDNRIEIPLPGGPRSFPWVQSYMWSRSHDSHVVASALMALEAWAHLRIENGEPVQVVLDDVLGPEGSPAAYLLVAVDVMLSHWPKTRDSIWPFAAASELLALDHQRYRSDIINGDAFGTNWVHPEPAGRVKLADLRRRLSRRCPLGVVLGEFGTHGPADLRQAMQQLLRADAARLGAPDLESDGFSDARFAAMSALNQLDPANYAVRGADDDGKPILEYVSPPDEAGLLAELQKKAQHGSAQVALRSQLMRALSEARCSAELLERGVRWATSDPAVWQADAEEDEETWIELTRFIVAALVMRDGSPELKDAYGQWARAQLTEAQVREPDGRGFPKQLQYNAGAIAAVGFLAAYREGSDAADLERVLHLTSRHDTGMASVLRAELAAQRSVQPELIRSLVRLGFVSCIYALPQRDYDDFGSIEDYRTRVEARETARKQAEQTRLENAVAAELRWFAAGSPEPNLPSLPDPRPPKERGILLGKVTQRRKRAQLPSRAHALDPSGAAQWLSLTVEVWRTDRPDLLCALVRHCWPWTAGASGVGCEANEEPGELAFEWNHAYFAAALAAAVAAGDGGFEAYVLDPLAQLPEERFLDAIEGVLHAMDELWLNRGLISDAAVQSMRETLAQRIEQTRSWRRLASERSAGTEIHLAGAVAAMFLGQHRMGQAPRCYVLPPGAGRMDPLLPMLTRLAEQAAGSTFVAVAFLSVLEVEPHAKRLTFVARGVAAWWKVQGANAEFWIDHAIGRRLCEWIEKAVLSAPVSKAVLNSEELISIVDILVHCGTPLGRALEERLTARRDDDGT